MRPQSPSLIYLSLPPRNFLFFFFSSRRRHTRWNCDWSSDVCSSDLAHPYRVRALFGRPVVLRDGCVEIIRPLPGREEFFAHFHRTVHREALRHHDETIEPGLLLGNSNSRETHLEAEDLLVELLPFDERGYDLALRYE